MTKTATSWLRPGLLILFLLPALAYGGYSIADRWYQSYVLAEEEAQLRREIAQLRLENLRLQGELTYARSDQYIESVAREQLNLVRPGDRAILLVGPPRRSTPEPTPRREATPVAERSPWRKLLDPIFGR